VTRRGQNWPSRDLAGPKPCVVATRNPPHAVQRTEPQRRRHAPSRQLRRAPPNKPLKQSAAPRRDRHRLPLARGEVPRARSSRPAASRLLMRPLLNGGTLARPASSGSAGIADVMKLEIPGQFRGPECRALIPVTTQLRRQLEPFFVDIAPPRISTVAFILRVGGTLGEFEPLPSAEPERSGETLSYDIIVPSHQWAGLSPPEIRRVICSHLRPALSDFIQRVGASQERANALLAAVA
jgi:hypothetical protein